MFGEFFLLYKVWEQTESKLSYFELKKLNYVFHLASDAAASVSSGFNPSIHLITAQTHNFTEDISTRHCYLAAFSVPSASARQPRA